MFLQFLTFLLLTVFLQSIHMVNPPSSQNKTPSPPKTLLSLPGIAHSPSTCYSHRLYQQQKTIVTIAMSSPPLSPPLFNNSNLISFLATLPQLLWQRRPVTSILPHPRDSFSFPPSTIVGPLNMFFLRNTLSLDFQVTALCGFSSVFIIHSLSSPRSIHVSLSQCLFLACFLVFLHTLLR